MSEVDVRVPATCSDLCQSPMLRLDKEMWCPGSVRSVHRRLWHKTHSRSLSFPLFLRGNRKRCRKHAANGVLNNGDGTYGCWKGRHYKPTEMRPNGVFRRCRWVELRKPRVNAAAANETVTLHFTALPVCSTMPEELAHKTTVEMTLTARTDEAESRINVEGICSSFSESWRPQARRLAPATKTNCDRSAHIAEVHIECSQFSLCRNCKWCSQSQLVAASLCPLTRGPFWIFRSPLWCGDVFSSGRH